MYISFGFEQLQISILGWWEMVLNVVMVMVMINVNSIVFQYKTNEKKSLPQNIAFIYLYKSYVKMSVKMTIRIDFHSWSIVFLFLHANWERVQIILLFVQKFHHSKRKKHFNFWSSIGLVNYHPNNTMTKPSQHDCAWYSDDFECDCVDWNIVRVFVFFFFFLHQKWRSFFAFALKIN